MDLQKILDIVGDDLTETQRKYLQATIDAGGNKNRAARDMGVSRAAIRQAVSGAVKKATLRGWSPNHGLTNPLPPGFGADRISQYVDKHGERAGHWVIGKKSPTQVLDELKELIAELKDDLPSIPHRNFKGDANAKLHTVYPLGDPHIGMLSYDRETGQNWDLRIAEKTFLPAFDRLIKAAPSSEEATIIDLGDFWHADNLEGRTARSGHKVDMDGRFSKMIAVGYRILRRMIESALDHHKYINVIILPGNHDDVGSLFLRESLEHIYETEPRVRINPSIAVFQYFTWGSVLVGCHHGHTAKLPALPLIMATDRAREWGDCKYRYWYTGHIHHDSKKEFQGCIVESFRTLAGPEAYAIEAGYRSGQDSKCIVLHRDFGEVERHTVDIDRVDS